MNYMKNQILLSSPQSKARDIIAGRYKARDNKIYIAIKIKTQTQTRIKTSMGSFNCSTKGNYYAAMQIQKHHTARRPRVGILFLKYPTGCGFKNAKLNMSAEREVTVRTASGHSARFIPNSVNYRPALSRGYGKAIVFPPYDSFRCYVIAGSSRR